MREKDALRRKTETFVAIDDSRLGHSAWRRVSWTFHQQHNMTDKVFVIERLQLTTSEPTSIQSAPDQRFIGQFSTELVTGSSIRLVSGAGDAAHRLFPLTISSRC
jgi:hypothetical protein